MSDFLNDESGYELSDPKHPTYPERMADLVDTERKRKKEEPTPHWWRQVYALERIAEALERIERRLPR